ncbi:uncharacterized protein CC84DRAFT_1204479 [Paraphaeosphaeria sporulosa]|uniref:Uncharacterized protein n=1 Tax=Paraphaeosphaeria sporulosa TaxID=1460663 RepID=A0A177CGU3_9PLEO|nr:uncharacterized protein CC84DRAFT_1204479 [Paraphaeosphaeria sporulosa]OAG06794.1 hypothetical protein CC84DRAFT_1204479 [Paraphaeosphaeria sporulosa]
MAPIRRYLRITKHSVLEVRIYLDRPSDAETWLLRRDNPALPRVIQAVRPLVLPKLREENERKSGRGKGKAKKKGVKDIVVEDDFEVSIFLTEHSSRHSVLTKQKVFKDKPRIQSNSGKLTNWLNTGNGEQPLVINDGPTETVIIREEEDDEPINLEDVPEADGSEDQTTYAVDEQDQKKKLGLNTSYDGFSIYGRILCLVVKRRGVRHQAGNSSAHASSQQMLENWVSTQAQAEQVNDDEDIG